MRETQLETKRSLPKWESMNEKIRNEKILNVKIHPPLDEQAHEKKITRQSCENDRNPACQFFLKKKPVLI